jgi:hypothetical protein
MLWHKRGDSTQMESPLFLFCGKHEGQRDTKSGSISLHHFQSSLKGHCTLQTYTEGQPANVRLVTETRMNAPLLPIDLALLMFRPRRGLDRGTVLRKVKKAPRNEIGALS